jgi:hypothetical protein
VPAEQVHRVVAFLVRDEHCGHSRSRMVLGGLGGAGLQAHRATARLPPDTGRHPER